MAVKQVISSCKAFGETTGADGEICALVKFSPKRENFLGIILEQVEGEFDDENETYQFSSLDKLCITGWKIRATCLQKLMNNYSLLLSLREESLLEKVDVETSARIKGCKS